MRGLVIEFLYLVHRHIGLGAEHAVAQLAGVVAVGEAVAREYAAQNVALLGGRSAVLAEQVRVDLGYNSGVLRTLHAALDLERGHTPVGKLGNVSGEHEILERQRIAAAVRQAARLCTQTAVARALTDHGGQVALTRVAHAQRTVHEHLGLDTGLLGDEFDLLAGAFPAEHHARKADVARLLCCVERVNGHLRGGVQREIRRVCVDEPRQPQILHDKRVRACFVQEFCVLECILKLAVARKNVECDIGFYVACAAVGDGVCHLVMRKALCVAACVEHAEAHIDRACTGLHSGANALRRTGGSKKFYFIPHLRL